MSRKKPAVLDKKKRFSHVDSAIMEVYKPGMTPAQIGVEAEKRGLCSKKSIFHRFKESKGIAVADVRKLEEMHREFLQSELMPKAHDVAMEVMDGDDLKLKVQVMRAIYDKGYAQQVEISQTVDIGPRVKELMTAMVSNALKQPEEDDDIIDIQALPAPQ